MLYIVGLGLGDENDITLKGKQAIDSCELVFLEAYTSVLGVSKERLEEVYGKEVVIADRDAVEIGADQILEPAKTKNVAFLVVGDAICATTHMDLIVRAQELDIKYKVIYNASIMTAAGVCGLQLYTFGQTISIPFFTEEWQPDSFYDKIKFNQSGQLHTLCLLDIKVKEPDFEAMVMGKTKFLPPRFMTVNRAIEQLLLIESKRQEGVLSNDTLAVGLARVGQDSEQVVSGTFQELLEVDFGAPLHSLVIAGEMHELEQRMFDNFRVSSKPAQATSVQ